MRNSILTTKLSLTGRSSATRQCRTSSSFVLYSCINGGWPGGHDKFVEIDDSCFSRQKYDCSRLCTTVWVFVGVKWEWGTPVLHLSQIAPLRHCLPSLRHASYLAPESSVTAGGTCHSVDCCMSFVTHGCLQIRSSPHGCKSRLTSGLTEKTKLYVW